MFIVGLRIKAILRAVGATVTSNSRFRETIRNLKVQSSFTQ
jgi:hypothetical protein